MIQNQNAAFQPNQYQMLGGPGGYPPRRDDHRGGRQVISTMWAVEGKQHTAHCYVCLLGIHILLPVFLEKLLIEQLR